MTWLLGRLLRNGFKRGLLEGSRGWLYVGVAAAAVNVAKRILTEPEETVYSAELKPGQGIEVRTVRREKDEPKGRKKRR
ncbi:MAG: hypothetical protein FJW86_12310 [Actinobacteria bacterium]|nr:hypothetical protein [Actinomycetota bacterium]